MNKKEIVLQLHNKGLIVNEIAEETGFSKSTIRYIINHANLRCNKSSSIARIDSFFEEFILGNMLGDGCVTKDKRISIAHSLKQKEYCKFKYNIFKEYNLANAISEYTIKHSRYINGFFKEIRFKTKRNDIFEKFRILYYGNNKRKHIPNEKYLSQYLSPLAIAIWFCDAGNASDSNLQLNTQSFDIEEILILRYVLLEKYGIKTTINNLKIITILSESIKQFVNLIDPFVINTMKYKLIPYNNRVLYKSDKLLEHPEEGNQQPS